MILVLRGRQGKEEVPEDVRCAARGSISSDATLAILEKARQVAAYLKKFVSCYIRRRLPSAFAAGARGPAVLHSPVSAGLSRDGDRFDAFPKLLLPERGAFDVR